MREVVNLRVAQTRRPRLSLTPRRTPVPFVVPRAASACRSASDVSVPFAHVALRINHLFSRGLIPGFGDKSQGGHEK